MGKPLIICIISIICAAVAACSSSGCLDNGSAIPLAGFYDSSSKKIIALDAIDIYAAGAPNDSLILGAGSRATQVYLPFTPAASQIRWAIDYRQENLEGLSDTITFNYESLPYFASDECGAMYYYRITNTEWTSLFIDSVLVVEPLISNIERERIRIYFRTNAEEGSSL